MVIYVSLRKYPPLGLIEMIVGGGDTNLEISRSLRSGLHYAIIFYSDVFRPDLESTQARLVSLYELVRYLCMYKPLMMRQNREKKGLN